MREAWGTSSCLSEWEGFQVCVCEGGLLQPALRFLAPSSIPPCPTPTRGHLLSLPPPNILAARGCQRLGVGGPEGVWDMSSGYCASTCPTVRKRKVGSLGTLPAPRCVRLPLSGVRERGAKLQRPAALLPGQFPHPNFAEVKEGSRPRMSWAVAMCLGWGKTLP